MMTEPAEQKRILAHFYKLNPEVFRLAEEFGPEAWRLDLPRGAQNRRLRIYQTVAGQQLSSRAVAAIWQRLEPLLLEDPTISQPERLRSAGLSRAKTACLQGLAGLDVSLLDNLPPEELSRRLLDHKGVGPWTVEMILIFVCGHPDIYSLRDLALRRAAATIFRLDLGDDRALAARVEVFSPYRSALALLLWHAADIGRLPGR